MAGSESRIKIDANRWARSRVLVFAAGLVTLLLLCTSVTLAAVEDGQPAVEESDTVAAVPRPPGGPEIVSERTATSETFQLPSGARETRIYEGPIHYKDAEGMWKPIEEGFEPAGSALRNGANSFDVQLPAQMGAGPVRLTDGDSWVAVRFLGEHTDAAQLEASGETATYEADGASFELSSLANGVKEEIVLADPSSPSAFHFELTASAGVAPGEAADGSIELRDEEETLVATLPAPTITDSSGVPPPEGSVDYALEQRGEAQWRLMVAADRDWLAEPDRAWPVRIDPSLTVPSPTLDCAIFNGPYSEWNLCGSGGWPYLGAKAKYLASGQNELSRTLLKFDFSAIPSSAYVDSASIGLYSPSTAKNTSGAQLFRVAKDWDGTATWLRYKLAMGSPKLWTSPGGDIDPFEGSEILTSKRGSQAGWWQFDVKQIAQKWVWASQNGNYGALISLRDESARVCTPSCIERLIEFHSSATGQKPNMALTYYLPAPASSKVATPTDGTRTARRLKLKAAWTAQGITGVTFQMRGEGQQSFQTIPANLVTDTTGKQISWPVAVSGVKESKPLYFDAANLNDQIWAVGGKVEIRVLFEGPPQAGGYSAPVTTTVDRNLGGTGDAVAQVGPGTVNLMTGNLAVARTDVSIPGFSSPLEFSRTHNSRDPGLKGDKGVLGQGWKPTVPVEAAGSGGWRSIQDLTISEVVEGQTYSFSYAKLTDFEGKEFAFERAEGGDYIIPPEAAGWSLTKEASGAKLVLAEPSGTRTTFENSGGGNEYLPISVSEPGGEGRRTRMVYELPGGNRRLDKVIAPNAEAITCSESSATSSEGCRVLDFTYESVVKWGAPSSYGDRLAKITYYAPGNGGPWDVAQYNYDAEGRLVEVWDPRISPTLKEKYSYESSGQLRTLTPAGLEPWTLEYGTYGAELAKSRLVRVKRPSLLASPSIAQTTIVYGVPLSGSGAPYDMSANAVAQWGQQDAPLDATAIFPADQIPNSPPDNYSRATVYYMDAEARLVNTATSAGAGTTAASITTSESDEFGNVVRELSAQNRLRALAAGSGSAERAHQLERKRDFSSDGTELQEEWGPLHSVRLGSGAAVQARTHRTIQYDAAWPGTGLKPHLPTRETIGASVSGQAVDADQRVSEFEYNWTLRKPTEAILDPDGLNLRTKTFYNSVSGLPVEQRQPSNPSGAGAGTRKTVYYGWAQSTPADCKSKAWANLPCKILPAVQPGTPGQPELLVKRFVGYNALAEPTEITESPGGGNVSVRRSVMTYNTGGRPVSHWQEGGGTAIPKSEILYNDAGLPSTKRFVCEANCGGFDDQAQTTTYDTLGRVIDYQDADGNVSSTTYDLLGRPVTTNDGKGTQTRVYDPTSGRLTELQDSAAGTFTASYDADGHIVEQGLPNGLVAKTTYDEVGEATGLSYVKTTMCSIDCTWLSFESESSVYGQVLAQTSTLSSQQYSYDKAGRLILVKDTPQGGTCTTRSYGYDANSNRESLITRAPGVGGACNTTSAGILQSYSYDAADRLVGPGISYDNFGRTTSLPGSYAGEGKTLTTGYFSNDMVASQTQGAITNTFELDGSLRPRMRLQAGGLEGTEIFHYAQDSSSPAWTQRGATWMRNIVGIDGELAAIHDSASGVVLQLTNLHGDVVATASLSQSETKPTATFEFDEFGVPKQAGPSRYGWLGGAQARTELPSGVIQMGVRSYVPAIGRFISVDPVEGGSASSYDYANADPVNGLDLTGERPNIWRHHRAVSRPPAGSPPLAPTPAPVVSPPAAAETATASGTIAANIMMYLKDQANIVAPIAWGTCVPESEIGPDKQVSGAFGGRTCIPKLKYHVTNAAQLPAIKANGWAWCVVTNAWVRTPVRGVWGWYGAVLLFGAWCSGERAWAYVYIY